MEIAPFGVNRAENAISEKVCKSEEVFATRIENEFSGWANRGRRGAGLRCER
jgi:hypothetical protein